MPAGSDRLDSWTIDGIAAGFIVPLWQPAIADRVEHVYTIQALQPGAVIVAAMCDTGLQYIKARGAALAAEKPRPI
ncbi:MAG TPA: hypothetical protein VM639_03100 [Dongiaceae bacterium]|nr:hypothetical protein [Dongiaceae bacterium]